MRVSKIMSQDVVTVSMDDTLDKVRRIFSDNNFHHLLVVEDKKLLGVISDRDLFKAISPRLDTAAETTKDLASLNKRVHQIMSRDVVTLIDTASVKQAVQTFNDHKISCIPIVNSSQCPVGILSWRDIMRVLIKKTQSDSASS